ncbi:sigma-70 family RNA polymerase sigma factor [Caldovatus sp. SYSU G05006]|uniref:Sigma-70 family RNA polymerase sigma factor n=2 Tax=Caldovatus aquaticus TaxID=2865671 RepID=A0ABS7F3P9_9PROT|nr:sigma-70 family RNA polymerase sigma factor [Caldovatus aquaticus]MBW8270226.1 sigma-70 family RNA polymerase sigma factor [Caldovatus aquaticus]
MQLAVAQQDKAFDPRTTLARLLPELRAFARLLAGSRAEGDDLVQEALLRMLRALPRFRVGAAEDPCARLRSWAFAVLRNAFRESHRRRRREVVRIAAAGPPEEGRPPPQEHEAGLHDLERTLASLPLILREALVLVGAQGLSCEEAAALCNVPAGTMRARLSRGRRLLAAALDGAPPRAAAAGEREPLAAL